MKPSCLLFTSTSFFSGLVFSFLFLSCGDNKPLSYVEEETNEARLSAPSTQKIKADTIATGLQSPWGMVFLPDKRILITEKTGSIRIVKDRKLLPEKIEGVPKVYTNGQGGLMDIQLHPSYAKNGWIYLSYSKPGSGGGSTTLARARLQGNKLIDLQELFVVDPFVASGVHFGSRIAFDGKGHVFITTGERGTKSNAQNLGNHNGKVIRLHDDGRVPADNPFVNTPGARPEIWTYGHRNMQGMAYDASSGILWTHEHGPKGGDEINIEEKGKNYGWPLVTYGIDYDGSIISNEKERPGINPPIHVWVPSIAPCGMALVTSDRYKGWKGSLLVGALAGRHIARVAIKDRKSAGEEKLINGMGRVRAVAQAPDGYIYVLTESPGLFLRLYLCAYRKPGPVFKVASPKVK
jgi:aldose sugar dehydrogenase